MRRRRVQILDLLPPGIVSSDKIETRFGTLVFFSGFPDKAWTEKQCHDLRLPARRAGRRALLVNQTWRQCTETRRKP